jgi:hypothetical protein
MPVIYEYLKHVIVFVSGKPVRPSLMLNIGAHERGFTVEGPSLINKHLPGTNTLA